MSWSIPYTNTNKDDIPKLEEAIDRAHRKNILMFCSASDAGIDTSYHKLYPAACSDKVFRIGELQSCNLTSLSRHCLLWHAPLLGAAKSTGQTDERVGGQVIDFTIPGQIDALEESPTLTQTSGSSASTALAAGLAGLILFCVGMTKYNSNYFDKLHQKALMERVLGRLTRTEHSSEGKLLCIKEFFREEFANLDWDQTGERELDKLVTKLLRFVKSYYSRHL